MKYLETSGWFHYGSDETYKFDYEKCGKWMPRFLDQEYAKSICKKAIDEGICYECKCSVLRPQDRDGVICIYLNCDDIEGHKRVINFMIENNLIRKTSAGKMYNMSFKLNSQTRAHEYGEDFKAEIKLEDFIDLYTGEWIHE